MGQLLWLSIDTAEELLELVAVPGWIPITISVFLHMFVNLISVQIDKETNGHWKWCITSGRLRSCPMFDSSVEIYIYH